MTGAARAMNSFIIAQTERMLIRRFLPQDAAALTHILGDPQVMRYSIKGVCSAEDTRRFIAGCMNSYSEYGYGAWALETRHSGALVGLCGLSPTMLGSRPEIEIGYRLAPGSWGRGLATEAVAQVLEEGFGRIGLRSVVAIVAAKHAASLRVAHKAGFSTYVNACYHGFDVRIHRMTLQQWRDMKAGAVSGSLRQ